MSPSPKIDIGAAWKHITAHLQGELDGLRIRIKNYPSPIPACDEHFNWLLEQRVSISVELVKARELSRHADAESTRRFLQASAHIDRGTRDEIDSTVARQS